MVCWSFQYQNWMMKTMFCFLSLDETIVQHGAEFNLGLHKYHGDNFSPRGHKYIREFECEKVPTTIYRVGV